MADEDQNSLARLQDDIKSHISANLGPSTRQGVIDSLLKRTVEKNTATMIAGLDKLDKLLTEQRKLEKPDINTVAPDGSKAGVFSADAWKKLEEHRQQVLKLTDGLNKALAGDFAKLTDLVK